MVSNGLSAAERAAALIDARQAGRCPKPIAATAFAPFDPSTLPPRRLVFGSHYHRGYVGITAGPSGVSKSTRELIDAVSMTLGKDLLGLDRVHGGKKRVWVMNLEDDALELRRRIAAICIRFDVDQQSLNGLFVDSGRDRELIIATETRDGVIINRPDVDALKAEMQLQRIDVLMVDPFVESHSVSESLNDSIKQVMAEWRQIAHDCNCAVELVHHLRKTNKAESTIDDVRGAVAMIGSARSVRLMSTMSESEAIAAGIEPKECRRYVGVNNGGKTNFSVPSDARDWFYLESVRLGNGDATYPDGDFIGVPVPWRLPSPLAALSVENCQAIRALAAAQADPAQTARTHRSAKGWFGVIVAELLEMNLQADGAMKEVDRILQALERAKWLKKGSALDANRVKKPVFLPCSEGTAE